MPGGSAFLSKYNGSFNTSIASTYTEYIWYEWLFSRVSSNFWTKKNQRLYFDWLAEKFFMETQETWYQGKLNEIVGTHGQAMVIQNYKGSYFKALESAYPEYSWYPWLFVHPSTPSHYYEDQS